MPTETLGRNVTANLVTNPAQNWHVAADFYVDDDTSQVNSGYASGFFENAIVNLVQSVPNYIRLMARTSPSTHVAVGLIPPNTHSIALWDIVATPEDRATLRGSYGALSQYGGPVKGLFWAVTAGEQMPDSIRLDSNYTYSYQRSFGRDVTAAFTTYEYRAATFSESSEWVAPEKPQVVDNEFYVSTIAQKGVDHDKGGQPYYSLAVYELPQLIAEEIGIVSGEYLGASRDFY